MWSLMTSAHMTLSDLKRSNLRSLRFRSPISCKGARPCYYEISLQKIAICHTSCRCQAERQGPWTSCLITRHFEIRAPDTPKMITSSRYPMFHWCPRIPNISRFHSTASCFKVYSNFETSAPNEPKMALNIIRSNMPQIFSRNDHLNPSPPISLPSKKN